MSLRHACVFAVVFSFGCSAGGGGDSATLSDNGSSNESSGIADDDPLFGGNGSDSNDSTGALLDVPETDVPEDCDNILEVTYRDFSEAHPDFEMSFSGDVVRLQLVEADIGSDRKPVFKDSIGCPPEHDMPGVCANWSPTQPTITDADTFSQWYRTEEGVNYEIPGTLELTETGEGTGVYIYDDTEFFPLGADDGFGITPKDHHMQQNFLFTTEIHLNFTYVKGQEFTFRGDDDLWIFVNGKLALDLGSMHNAEEGTIDFDAQAEALGIVAGNDYPMDIFHAERHTSASNFHFETNIACFTPAVIR